MFQGYRTVQNAWMDKQAFKEIDGPPEKIRPEAHLSRDKNERDQQ